MFSTQSESYIFAGCVYNDLPIIMLSQHKIPSSLAQELSYTLISWGNPPPHLNSES